MASSAAAKGRRTVADERPESTFVADDKESTFTVKYANGLDVDVTTGTAWVRLPRQRAVRQNIGVARRFGGHRRVTLPGDGVLGLSMARPFYGPHARTVDQDNPRLPFAERVVGAAAVAKATGGGDGGGGGSSGRRQRLYAVALRLAREGPSVLSIGSVKRQRYEGQLAWLPTLPWRQDDDDDAETYGPFQVRMRGVGLGDGVRQSAAEWGEDIKTAGSGTDGNVRSGSGGGKSIIGASLPDLYAVSGGGVISSASTSQSPNIYLLPAAEAVTIFGETHRFSFSAFQAHMVSSKRLS